MCVWEPNLNLALLTGDFCSWKLPWASISRKRQSWKKRKRRKKRKIEERKRRKRQSLRYKIGKWRADDWLGRCVSCWTDEFHKTLELLCMPACSPRPLEHWAFWWKSGNTVVFLFHLCLGSMFSQISYKHTHGLACSTGKKLSVTCLCDSCSSGGSFPCVFIARKSTLHHKEQPIPYIKPPLTLPLQTCTHQQISCICPWFRVGWWKHFNSKWGTGVVSEQHQILF